MDGRVNPAMTGKNILCAAVMVPRRAMDFGARRPASSRLAESA